MEARKEEDAKDKDIIWYVVEWFYRLQARMCHQLNKTLRHESQKKKRAGAIKEQRIVTNRFQHLCYLSVRVESIIIRRGIPIIASIENIAGSQHIFAVSHKETLCIKQTIVLLQHNNKFSGNLSFERTHKLKHKMKKFGFRHLMYGWLAVVALVLTSCDSENATPINDKTLPGAIAKDFHERCEDYTIKRVYTGPEPYFDSGAIETFVTSEDNAGNECVVVYVDNAWNRTVRMLSDIDQLPSSVRYRLLTINQEARNDEFWEIKEVTQASINGTYYILCYLQDSPKLKNLVHTLVIDSKGTVVKACTYKLNNAEYKGTIPGDMEWITAHYKGSEVLGFVNDSGDDNYLSIHDGVLKSVYFRVSRKGTTWKETCYPLPKGTTVPSNVLDSLHADYPDFTYTEVSILETPVGIVYLFTDGNRPDRLGHYVECKLKTE